MFNPAFEIAFAKTKVNPKPSEEVSPKESAVLKWAPDEDGLMEDIARDRKKYEESALADLLDREAL